MRLLQDKSHQIGSLPGLDGDAKLRIHLSSGNRLVGVRVDSRSQAEQHLLAEIPFPGFALDRLDLLCIIGDEISDMVVHRVCDVPVGLVVRMEIRLGKVESCLQGGIDLARGDDVDSHPLFLHDLVHPFEAIGLGGVERNRARAEIPGKGGLIGPATATNPFLVHQIERSPVLLRQGDGILACEQQVGTVSRNRNILANHRFTAPLRQPVSSAANPCRRQSG